MSRVFLEFNTIQFDYLRYVSKTSVFHHKIITHGFIENEEPVKLKFS